MQACDHVLLLNMKRSGNTIFKMKKGISVAN